MAATPTKAAPAILLLITVPSTAHAYIDPGAGAMLIQGLIGGIVGALFILRLYWTRLKKFVVRATGGSIAAEEPQIKEERPIEDA